MERPDICRAVPLDSGCARRAVLVGSVRLRRKCSRRSDDCWPRVRRTVPVRSSDDKQCICIEVFVAFLLLKAFPLNPYSTRLSMVRI